MSGAGAGMSMMGSGFQTMAQLKQLGDDKRASLDNSIALNKQADYVQDAGNRKMQILQNNQDKFYGSEVSRFAKAGISLDGSALQALAGDQTAMQFERNATEAQNNWDVMRLRNAALQQDQRIRDDEDAVPWTIGAGILGAGSSAGNSYLTANSSSRSSILGDSSNSQSYVVGGNG